MATGDLEILYKEGLFETVHPPHIEGAGPLRKEGIETMRGILKPLAGAAFLATMLAAPAFAADPAPTAGTAAPETVTETTTPGDQSFEIQDPADTPPVNYRSEQDERYDTPSQRDAEMYAEQYEKQKLEERQKEKKLLDNMNTLSAPGGPINSDLGANDAGFPPKAPY